MSEDGALAQAARAAGLVDHDLLRLVRPGLHATDAVADLRQRYPSAFPGAPKLPKDMTRAEMLAELSRAERERRETPPPGYPHGKHVNDMSLDEMEVFERHHGMAVNASERWRRDRIRAQQREQREINR